MNPDISDQAEDGVRLDELAAVRLFAGADLRSIGSRLKACPVKRLFEGELLIAPGLGGHVLYLLLAGALRVHLDSLEARPLQRLGAGDAVGGSSLARGRPTYVVADAPSSVLPIDRETFWSLVYAEHAVALNLLRMIIERFDPERPSLSPEPVPRPAPQRRSTSVDHLTGLPNRAALLHLLRRQMLRSAMGARPLSVLVVATDEFAPFTSGFGKAAGEEVLCTVAGVIRDQVRPTDIVARLDDTHRFAVILPECNERGARRVAERIAEEVSHAVVMMPDQSILPPVTISAGVAEMREHARAEELLEAAGCELPLE